MRIGIKKLPAHVWQDYECCDKFTFTFNKKLGLTILFSNGKKLSKPNAKISVAPGTENSWNYSAFVPLLPADIKLLSENVITDVKLYIYDGSLNNGSELKELLNCIIKAK